MKDSVLISFVIKIYNVLCVWYSNSILGKVLDGIYNGVSKAVLGCVAGRFFTQKPKDGKYLRHSIVYKTIKWLSNLIRKPVRTFSKVRLEIADTSLVHDICENLLGISTSTYGTILLAMSLTALAGEWIAEGTVFGIKGYLSMAVLVVGVVLILVNRTPDNLGQGSKLVRFVRSFFIDDGNFDNDNPLYLQEEAHKAKYITVSVLFGICLGAIFTIYSLVDFIMIMGVIIGTIFVLKFPLAGLFVFVAGAPILPTMVQVGLVALCGVSLLVAFVTNPRFKLKTGSFDIFVLFFMAILGYGIIASFDFTGSLKMGLVYLMFTGSYFLITNLVDTSRKWKIFTVGFISTAIVVALYGILQNFTGVNSTESWVDSQMFEDISVRVFSTLGNPNVLGEYLIIAITMALGFVWSEKWVKKPWYTLAFVVFALCMVFTWSRGAWLGLLGAMVIFGVIKDKRLAVLVIAGIMLVPIVGGDAIMSRIGSVGDTADTSTAYRVSIWISSVRMIKEFWLGGIGMGPDVFASIYGDYARSGASFALHSHNVFLQIMLNFGVTGMIVFLVMMLYYIKNVYSHLALGTQSENSKVINTLVLAMSCGVLGYFAQGVTDNVWYNYKMYGIWWIIMALTIAGIRCADKEK